MKTLCPASPLFMTHRGVPDAQSRPVKVRNFLDLIVECLRGFAVCGKRNATRARKVLDSSLVKLSTVTTPNGPWVYTIVPWED
jgi:hypothetical protein